jgi:hypothetical protein
MFKKPNTKTITGVATRGAAIVVGAKVGDGLNAVMPDSVASYKRWIIGVGALAAAAFINPTTTIAQVSQDGLVGMGAKQLIDELSSTLSAAIPVKPKLEGAKASLSAKFMDAVIDPSRLAAPSYMLGQSWQGDNADMWARPQESAPMLTNSFTGV